MPKVSSVFIETLKNHKVDRFFCVPGESYLPVMNELVSNPRLWKPSECDEGFRVRILL